MSTSTTLRRAAGADAIALGDLEVRSKAHWKYDAAFMAAMDAALRPSADDVDSHPFYVLVDDGTMVGFFAFGMIDGKPFLSDMFIDPPYIGRGFGRVLWNHAIEIGRTIGYETFFIESDPNAEAFYFAMGARRIGTRISPDSGRELPLLEF